MKLRNMWMGLSCITCALISLSCTNVNMPKGPTVEHTPNQKQKVNIEQQQEQKEQAKEVASKFISGVFKNDDPRKAVFGAAFEAAFLKNISNNAIKQDISAESITKALSDAANKGSAGCIHDFINDNDPTGNIIFTAIGTAVEVAHRGAGGAGGGAGAPVAVKSQEEMTDFFDKMIKAGITKDCFK